MKVAEKIRKLGLVKIVIGLILLVLAMVFLFKEKIKKHKVTKAKVELFKRMTHTKPAHWPKEAKQVFDSIIMEKKDTILPKQSHLEN